MTSFENFPNPCKSNLDTCSHNTHNVMCGFIPRFPLKNELASFQTLQFPIFF